MFEYVNDTSPPCPTLLLTRSAPLPLSGRHLGLLCHSEQVGVSRPTCSFKLRTARPTPEGPVRTKSLDHDGARKLQRRTRIAESYLRQGKAGSRTGNERMAKE